MHVYFEGDGGEHWSLSDLIAEMQANNGWWREAHAQPAPVDAPTGGWPAPAPEPVPAPEMTAPLPLYVGGLGYPARWVAVTAMVLMVVLAVTGW
jgi:hypothetical protein